MENTRMKNSRPCLFRPFFMVATLVTIVVGLAPPVHAGSGVRLGYLACEAIKGTRFNLLITSSVDIKCIFKTPQGIEHYKGETGIDLGVDLNFKSMEKIDFAVISLTSQYPIGSYSLSGKYKGGKASASLGIGIGAAVLIGGGAKNFSLQPVALEGNTGLGAAAGLGYLHLVPDPARDRRRDRRRAPRRK